ncbi:hypothetical protein B0H13DRAFT_2340211 [Mycena leptocephala]|nr:hypothetical protein B0H13DRAFT_2340211 [Mycena leptocephala]
MWVRVGLASGRWRTQHATELLAPILRSAEGYRPSCVSYVSSNVRAYAILLLPCVAALVRGRCHASPDELWFRAGSPYVSCSSTDGVFFTQNVETEPLYYRTASLPPISSSSSASPPSDACVPPPRRRGGGVAPVHDQDGLKTGLVTGTNAGVLWRGARTFEMILTDLVRASEVYLSRVKILSPWHLSST